MKMRIKDVPKRSTILSLEAELLIKRVNYLFWYMPSMNLYFYPRARSARVYMLLCYSSSSCSWGVLRQTVSDR